jgi:hypothetical protein
MGRRFELTPTVPKVGTFESKTTSVGVLPTDAKERKGIPIYSGLIKYFPDALVAVARLSQIANEQHNPGEPLHWSRNKSADHHDTLSRHLFESGTIDTDGVRHSVKVAWRALAIAQLEIEKAREDGEASEDGTRSVAPALTQGCLR